jgi:hypothetical protein
VFLGVIESTTGAAASNFVTPVPFLANPLQPAINGIGGQNMIWSLAGKMLWIQTASPGYYLPSNSPALNIANQNSALQQGQAYGVQISSSPPVPVPLLMNPTYGWLQFLPASGPGKLFVWELV